MHLIEKIRKKRKIKQVDLCQGLCSISMLSRIEKGKKQGDKMLIEALFERLGKTLLYWERILNNNDIRLFQLKLKISFFLEERNIEKVEELLLQYKNFKGVNKNLHMQYRTWIEAQVLLLKNQKDESIKKVREALTWTFSKINEEKFELKGVYLCHQEIQIYLMWTRLKLQENRKEGYYYLKQLLEYIEEHIDDNQYLEQLYPMILYEIAKVQMEEGEFQEAFSVCEKGIDILRKNETLNQLKSFLKLRIQIGDKLGIEEDKNRTQKWYQLIEWLEQYKEKDTENIFVKNRYGVYGIGEVFRNLRKDLNISQEKVMYFIQDEGYTLVQETISRIENGHRNPTEKTCENYLKQFNKELQFYCSPIQSDDYEIQELRYEFGRQVKLREVEKAKEILLEIEKKIDTNNRYNMQFVKKGYISLEFLEKKISEQEYRKKLIDVLKLTVHNYNKIEKEDKIYGILNRNEINILNNIAISYKYEGDYHNAICWYKKILDYFEEQYLLSGISDYLMLFTNYVNALGSNGQYMESTKAARRGIELCVKNKDASYISYLLYNIAWNYKEEGKKRSLSEEERKECCESFQMAYDNSVLFFQKYVKEFLEESRGDFIEYL